ncbi:GlcG/HbpS family heme-binding protein [Devosia ginsengisoli]|uniref:Heme-binding protein n=1 Tax=Devosia ginsengisoli TaxID=400770 RepID=A0A5B8LWI8_9HYPH|nr:heme-binding protein [Devosia ginsengisoli]QDZ12483.1 heme-binding protein [Devosia ginsengisoli]
MELRTAFALIEATLEEGRRRKARPLSVVVLDPGGHQIASAREDGAGFARLALAQGKAWGSLGIGFGSRTLSERVTKAPEFFAAAASLLDGRLLPAPGGVLLLRDGTLIGALGVSGDTGDTDEACALFAAGRLGLEHER